MRDRGRDDNCYEPGDGHGRLYDLCKQEREDVRVAMRIIAEHGRDFEATRNGISWAQVKGADHIASCSIGAALSAHPATDAREVSDD